MIEDKGVENLDHLTVLAADYAYRHQLSLETTVEGETDVNYIHRVIQALASELEEEKESVWVLWGELAIIQGALLDTGGLRADITPMRWWMEILNALTFGLLRQRRLHRVIVDMINHTGKTVYIP